MAIDIIKRDLIEKLLYLTQTKEMEVKKASKDAQERANEAEGAMQSRYDTFKEEGQNLAAGLKMRHEELKVSASIIEEILKDGNLPTHTRIQHYSYVEIEFDDGNDGKFFITPLMGGEKLDGDITIITPSSPIGDSLMNKEEGDEFQYSVANNKKKGEVVKIK
jgi:transcription elongation GreA/GreB family factor